MRVFRFFRLNNNILARNAGGADKSDPEEGMNPSEIEYLLSSDRDSSSEETSNLQGMASSEPSINEARNDMRVDLPPPKPDMHAPPPYEEVDFNSPTSEVSSIPYDEGTVLQPPSYEEVQRLKAIEAGEGPLQVTDSSGDGMQVVRISSLGALDPQTAEIAQEQLLGTDLMFFVAFTAAFLFNLVGIVLLLCLCHTVAGRTGALAGFGLSLAKWVVIFRHSTDLVADANSWLLWLIMVLGLLICVRAILQYISAKQEWQQLPHNSRQRFFLFY